VREKSGLALSSRNTYLSADDRVRALAISRTLMSLKRLSGRKSVSWVRKELERAGLKVDYVECVDARTLEPLKTVGKGSCVLVAAYAGKTRLIDNIVL
jgi:pantothenate synthetase